MNNSIMTMFIFAVTIMFIFTGCGSNTKTYETIENNITIEEPYEIPGGTAIIIDGSEDTTVSQENQTITIDCGEGGCGAISIGTELPE